MQTRNIIVIGASAGGLEPLKQLVGALPSDFNASVFIVWHISADSPGVLPEILNRAARIRTAHAFDNEPIVPNRIYVAPPDHHLLIEPGRVRVTRGPKENRFRPAVDPLFRSAAYAYKAGVIGVVLSGRLDDGTSGLWTIKQRGGLALVQDPRDAEMPSMPENAIREVAVDHIVPVAGMAELLVQLSQQQIAPAEPRTSLSKAKATVTMEKEADKRTEIEIRTAEEASAFELGLMKYGELTPYTCPECQGVLTALKEGTRTRFRCHTGHAFSADSLLAAVTEHIEDSLYTALRGIEESVMLLNHLGNHLAEGRQTALAALYLQKAKEAKLRAQQIRQVVLSHEPLSQDSLQGEVERVSRDDATKGVGE